MFIKGLHEVSIETMEQKMETSTLGEFLKLKGLQEP